MTVHRRAKMSAEAFPAWCAEQQGRFELVAGEVVAMALERAAHARAKTACLRALEAAILAAGQPCEAFPDGMAVRIDAATVYAPDALVRCGPTLDPDAIGVTDAITVVEVLSPSSRACDSGAKPDDDFLLPSLAH